MVAVEHDPIGDVALRVELRQRAQAGGAQRGGHAELVALLVGGVADADGDGPLPHRPRRLLPLGAGELLRVAHAAHVLRRRDHRGDRHRAGPGAPAHLVDAADHLVARVPELPLQPQRGAHPTGGPSRRVRCVGRVGCASRRRRGRSRRRQDRGARHGAEPTRRGRCTPRCSTRSIRSDRARTTGHPMGGRAPVPAGHADVSTPFGTTHVPSSRPEQPGYPRSSRAICSAASGFGAARNQASRMPATASSVTRPM